MLFLTPFSGSREEGEIKHKAGFKLKLCGLAANILYYFEHRRSYQQLPT
jgi:hypothetical protein